MERSQTTSMAATSMQRDAATRLHADYSDEESETPETAAKRREAAAGNVNSSAMDDDEDAELDDFALSSDDEDGAMSGKEPALDRAMMNELLLVCSNLGMLRVQNEGEEPVLMRGEDCEEWIHDLQRAIRRDHAKHKLVAKQLGKWKILQKKLLPLLINHQHDWSLVFSILKVLVMLTMKPTKESTNIAQQLKYLRAYKYAFLQHEIVPILMTILVDPLSRKGSARTAQEDFIQTLHEENVYEMILLFAQDIESAENREWNLLIMEMMDLTLDCSHPKAVAAFTKQRLTATSSVANAEPSQTPTQRPVQPVRAESLTQKLNSEKLSTQQRNGGSRRHSNFGGVLTLVGSTGRSTLLTNFSKAPEDQVPQAAKKPVARKRGGRQRAGDPVATDISEIFGSRAKVTESDQSTMSVLMEICDTLISKSYFQLTNSLKNEFRRGSSKLVSTDRLQYFHLVWFLTTYHRLKVQALKSHYRHRLKEHEKKKNQLLHDMDFQTQPPPAPEKPSYDEKAVLSTLDMFSFNFILQSIETYASVKNYHGMTVSVQLLTEMMAYLSELGASDDPRYQRIADSLQHKILYERDFLDRIPVLLKTWSPGIFSKEYVVDVVTLSHLVFKMLDAQGTIKVLSRRKAYLDSKKKKKKSVGEGDEEDSDSDEDEEESERQAQLLLEMQRKEADFDVRKYFQSILSSDTIKMYCFLLSSYRENSAKVNHYIHSFFYRAKHFKIQKHEEWTMQPLLFNIHVLLLFNKMLQDPLVQKQSEFKSFLDFIRGVVRDFFTLAEKNHLLFVEALLRQPYAAKTAMLLQRNYEPLDTMTKSRSEAVALGREKQIALINEVRRQKKAIDAEELEGEEEFQFILQPSDFQSSSLVAADKANKSQDDEDSGSEKEVGLGEPNAPTPSKKSPAKSSASAAAAKRKMKVASERAKNWTKVEDRYLEKMFMKYRHLPSVYEVISYEDMFQDRDRTAEQIERRVKYLKLHRKTHDSSDEDEKSDGDDDEDKRKKSDDEGNENSDLDLEKELTARPAPSEESSRLRRRLRRVTTLSDDSESDDDLLGGGAPKQTSPRDELTASPTPARANGPEDKANSRDSSGLSNDLEETEELQDDSGATTTDDPTSHAQEDDAGEKDTQVINNETTEEQADASMSEDLTREISQEDTEMIDESAVTPIDYEDDTQLIDGETEPMDDDAPAVSTEVGEVENSSVLVALETAGADTETQSIEESVDAEMTEATDVQEDTSVDAEPTEPTSNKRRRDGDEELHDDLVMSTSPQPKVARTASLEDNAPPAEED
ncbi:DNA topoisomerase i-interacting protein, partial [Globisporangium splendens]